MKVCYILKFVKGDDYKVYVGQSTNLEKRIKTHLSLLKNKAHFNINLQKLFDDGWEYDGKPIFYILNESDDARTVETRLIKEYLDKGLSVNIEMYGDTLTNHPDREKRISKLTEGIKKRYSEMSDEDREKLAERSRGKNNYMFGKTHSEKARRVISEKLRAFYQNHDSPNKGIKLSEKRRKNLSEYAKKRTGDKNPFFGKRHSEETKRKLALKSRGRIPTNSKHVSCGGVIYPSAMAAARALGISNSLITWRVNNKNAKYSDYFYLV